MINEPLKNFGEWTLIHRIRDIVSEYGEPELTLDDSALVPNISDDKRVWITIDPCPLPNIVQRLGIGDYYHAGWLCVVKSISDIAAMGGTPSGIVVAVDFSNDLTIDNFDRFFQGVIECAMAHDTHLIGGNIKEGGGKGKEKEHAVSCGIGYINKDQALMRGKVKSGDLLFIVDREDFGGYWAGIAESILAEKQSILKGKHLNEIISMALTPMAKVKQAQIMLYTAPPSFCMDNSDGMIASAFELVKQGDVDVVFSIEKNMFKSSIRKVAEAYNCDVRTWAYIWGSASLFCAADEATVKKIEAELNRINSNIVVVGEVHTGNGQVSVCLDDNISLVDISPALKGEQFVSGSFWEKGAMTVTHELLKMSQEELLLKKY